MGPPIDRDQYSELRIHRRICDGRFLDGLTSLIAPVVIERNEKRNRVRVSGMRAFDIECCLAVELDPYTSDDGNQGDFFPPIEVS